MGRPSNTEFMFCERSSIVSVLFALSGDCCNNSSMGMASCSGERTMPSSLAMIPTLPYGCGEVKATLGRWGR